MSTPYRPGPFTRLALRLASTKFGGWFFTTVTPGFDRWLLYKSSGQYSLAGLGAPTLLLITIGRKSGHERRTPLLYIEDGEQLVLVASRGGHPQHPAWYLNVQAKPAVEIMLGGQRSNMRAEVASGSERERLWQALLAINPWFERYQDRITREIPIVVLRQNSASES